MCPMEGGDIGTSADLIPTLCATNGHWEAAKTNTPAFAPGRFYSRKVRKTNGGNYCALFLVSCLFCCRSFSPAAASGSSLIVSLSILPVKRNGGW
jgi:hypothetical protein